LVLLNIEVKGNLARLLATENLVVEHRTVETASFDIKNRILTLPIWDTASGEVYDMLVGHEVGHALYTPSDYSKPQGVPQSYLNVIEDARIEKMMKKKFPGLARSFYTAYVELYKKDFFATANREYNTYTLIDRINLYFKVGIHANAIIPFNEQEKELVKLVEVAESFEDVVDAARKVLEYTKEQELDKFESTVKDTEQQGKSGGSSDQQSSSYEESFSEMDGNFDQSQEQNSPLEQEQPFSDEEDGQSETNNPGTFGNNGPQQELESETDKAFNESQKNIISRKGKDFTYVELPKLNLDSIIVSNEKITEELNEGWKTQSTQSLTSIDAKYMSFRKKSQREVNYLVKEFEMRKSADQYARSSVSKTGVLDTSKLTTYKWNEDLFKKITALPDGKNHGLIFILDWSGSMGNILKDTVKQLMNLLWFCRKVQIPFDVYCFTNDYGYHANYDYETQTRSKPKEHQKYFPNQIYVGSYFNLLNVVSSTSKVDIEMQFRNFWKLASSVRTSSIHVPAGYYLSGTPLNEAIVSLHHLIPHFKNKVKCQKTNVIILTDGEAQSIGRTSDSDPGKSSYGRINQYSLHDACILRDRITGRVYPPFGMYGCGHETTKIFLDSVSDKFPDVNLIGIRLASGREMYHVYDNHREHIKEDYEFFQKTWKKERSVEFKDCGYKSLYVMASDSLSNNFNFSSQTTDNLSTLKTDFAKSQKCKSLNKKMLSSFAGLIS